MKLIMDKGTQTEKEIELRYASEDLTNGRMTGSNVISLDGTIPDMSAFRDDPHFSALELHRKNGSLITLQGSYDNVLALNINIDEQAGVYNIQLVLGKEADYA